MFLVANTVNLHCLNILILCGCGVLRVGVIFGIIAGVPAAARAGTSKNEAIHPSIRTSATLLTCD